MNLIFLLCMIKVVWADHWNFYHELDVKTFQPPKPLKEDSYFGFSTTYDQYNKRMIISAPKENYIGEVYECDLSNINHKSCSIIHHSITSNATSYKDNFWFGATVKAGPTFVMACSPRYVTVNVDCENDLGMFGRCYLRKENETNFSTKISPERLKPIKELYKGKLVCIRQEKQMDTMGWSLDIGDNGTTILGSPGMFNKTGVAAIKVEGQKFLERINKIDQKLYNFGYSVAIGYFTSEKKLSYAVSTTYGSEGPGAIFFYTYNNYRFDPYMTLDKGVDVDVVGSMFGAILCTAKMNGQAKGNDLLVGAPTYYAGSEFNTGAVYVYSYSSEGTPPVNKRKIVGQKYGSLFGSAIITVGDLNGDKKDEIAIGAPFEDGGAVYLYSGAAILSSKTLTWLQKIKPATKNLVSFGYSLAALQDHDNNGCNELAVGAPYKDSVMLYRCLAVITVTKLYAEFPNVQNRSASRKTDFVFKVCMDIKYPEKLKHVTAELSTDVKLVHSFATLKNPNKRNVYTFKTVIEGRRASYCANVTFVLPLEKDYSIPIGYEIVTKLEKNPLTVKIVTGAHVLLSDNSMLTYSDTFWAGECSAVTKCISNLTLTVTSDLRDLPLITGTRDKGVFHVKVLNTGDVAYDPCVQFNITGGTLPQPPMYCSKVNILEETWSCKSMKPIFTNRTWEIENIVVDLRYLTNRDKNVTLNLEVFERCAQKHKSTSYVHSIPLTSNLDGVRIKGTTDIGENIYIPENELINRKHFKQIYTIINKGPTNFKDLTSIVKVQSSKYFMYQDTPVSIYKEATSETSRSDDSYRSCKVYPSENELTVTCRIESLPKDNYVRVAISMATQPIFLTKDILKALANVTINSMLTVRLEKKEKNRSLTTIIQLQQAFVELWVLVAAGLVGLLLLVILAIILYTSGFLQRKNKKKLINLKENVKRQSVRRSAMLHAPMPRPNPMLTEEIRLLRHVDPKDDICVQSIE